MIPAKFAVNRTNWAFIIMGMVILSLILSVELVGFWQERKKFSLFKPSVRWRLPMIMTTTFGLTMMIIGGLFEWVDWTLNPLGCEDYMAGFCTLFYVFMKQSMNLFMYDRAKIVHDALQLRLV